MVNSFYVVRNIGSWEVRNSENPGFLKGKFESEEEAKLALKEAYTSKVIAVRFEEFLTETAKELDITIGEIIKEVRS